MLCRCGTCLRLLADQWRSVECLCVSQEETMAFYALPSCTHVASYVLIATPPLYTQRFDTFNPNTLGNNVPAAKETFAIRAPLDEVRRKDPLQPSFKVLESTRGKSGRSLHRCLTFQVENSVRVVTRQAGIGITRSTALSYERNCFDMIQP